MWLVCSRLLRACRISFAVCVLLVVITSVAYSQSPPKGIDWKDNILAGGRDATSRHIPIMMFVAEDDAGTQAMSTNLEDPKVTSMLKHFACVFISRSRDEHAWRQAFVPWMVPNAAATYATPLLVFGDPQGKPRQEYRIEGGKLKVEELLKHLEKVLKELAPDEAKAIMAEELKALPLHEICKRLSDSVTFLEKNLSSETRVQFTEEVRSAIETCKFVKERLVELKDKEKQAQATERLKDLEKHLKELAKFTGKEKDKEKEKYGDYLKKAREAVDGLTSLIPVPPIEMETLVCKAIPLAKQVATVYELEYALKKIEFVKEVSFEKTNETFKVEEVEYKISVFTITYQKGKVKKEDIEKVFKEHYYEAKWETSK